MALVAMQERLSAWEVSNSTRAQEALTPRNELTAVVAQSEAVEADTAYLRDPFGFLRSDYTL
eukprot:12927461-Prorocentrum_lima.AAC.1